MKKLAIIFPGIGYHADKPLLYHSRRLAEQAGHEVLPVNYGALPPTAKDSPEQMQTAYEAALLQAEACLRDVDFSACGRLLFLSKSIGTAVAGAYAARHALSPFHVLYTPVDTTFSLLSPDTKGIAFTGTRDPWVTPDAIKEGCNRLGLPLTVIPNANHSLETGDTLRDLDILRQVMELTQLHISRL